MIKITCFPGSERNVRNGTVQEYTFREMYDELFKEPVQGAKHDGYFVRGELSPLHRKDDNLSSVSLLIIDGDASLDNPESAPPPRNIHRFLKEKNISHFIYTSHSHSEFKNKYRVVIHCDLPSKGYMKPTAMKIVKELNDANIPLKYVKEMGVWSQPWFIPRRDNPEDGFFETYFHEGEKYVATDILEGKINERPDSSTVHATAAERIRQIQTGEVLHDNLVALSWGFIRDGMHPTMVQATLEGIMYGCKVQDERWQSRFDDLGRYITDAVDKQSNFEENINLEGMDKEGTAPDVDIPWPPGLLGELSQSALNMQIYQYKEVAVISAIGLIAGICGRKFNVSNTGLNVYMTLIMRTGMGKDSISEFIETCLINLNELSSGGVPLSFLGTGRFTGPKAVYKDLQNARSQVCVFTEAGLLLRSNAGDVNGLTRSLLSLYTVSGNNRISKKETFSDSDDSIQQLRAPALTIINEATPETLLGAFKDSGSLENGLLPRQSIFRVSNSKPYPNKHIKRDMKLELMSRLSALVAKCAGVQAQSDPEAWNMAYSEDILDDIQNHAKECVDIYNNFIHSDTTKAIMASRLHIKALKFAAIASVFNHTDAVIKKDEWEWGKKIADYEYGGVDNFFKGSDTNNVQHDIATRLIGRAIIKIITNTEKNNKSAMDKRYRDAGIFSRYGLNQKFKNNSEISSLNDDVSYKSNPKTGIEKMLDYMVRNDYIVPIEDPFERKKNLYKVTELFKILMQEYIDGAEKIK